MNTLGASWHWLKALTHRLLRVLPHARGAHLVDHLAGVRLVAETVARPAKPAAFTISTADASMSFRIVSSFGP